MWKSVPQMPIALMSTGTRRPSAEGHGRPISSSRPGSRQMTARIVPAGRVSCAGAGASDSAVIGPCPKQLFRSRVPTAPRAADDADFEERGLKSLVTALTFFGRNHMRLTTVMLASTALAVALTAGALADTKTKKIAFSNNYAGNSWRQAMLKSYDIVTKKAVAEKAGGAADVFTTADKDVPTQAAQIQNLILQGYDAIVINASSPDALNGAVKQACDAGIVVVSFDGIVTEPSAWRVVVDFKDYGEQEVEHLAKWLPKGGNLLEIRGLAGTSIDDAIHSGILQGVTKNPQFKIVNTVEGD